MFSLTPSHTTWTNASNPDVGSGSALSGHNTSGRVVHSNGLNADGTQDNSIERVAYVAGEKLNAAARWFYKQASNAIEGMDVALRFPVAEAASAPLLRPNGNMLRTRDMPEALEQHPEVLQLKDLRRKPDFSTDFHKEFAEESKKTIKDMFNKSPVIIVSDEEHSWGRSKLLQYHLMLMASKGECVVLMDGTVNGKEKERLKHIFKEDYPVGLNIGLEADLPFTLSNLMFRHDEFLKLQSLPAANFHEQLVHNKNFIWTSFSKLLGVYHSEAYKGAYGKLLNSLSRADKRSMAPFIDALEGVISGKVPDMPAALTEWYIGASIKDRESVTLLLGRMMSELGKSLNKKDASHIARYLADPQNNFDDIHDTLALRVRGRTWRKAIEDTYNQNGGRLPIVIFEGWKHDEPTSKQVAGLMKKAKKPETEMKSEL